MKLNTLKAYIDDIMLTIRNNNISESEDLSYRQVELWIHAYRALLIKQDIDKGRDINSQYLQGKEYELEEIAYWNKTPDTSTCTQYITTEEVPTTIDLHFGSGIISVTDLYNSNIQRMSAIRHNFQKYRKYTSKDYTWRYYDKHIYVEGVGPLQWIRVNMLLENPMDGELTPDDPYPLPINLWPALKQMIMERELGVMIKMPSDDKNSDSLAGIKPKNNE